MYTAWQYKGWEFTNHSVNSLTIYKVRIYQSQCTKLDNIQDAYLPIMVYTAGQYTGCVWPIIVYTAWQYTGCIFTNHSVHSFTKYRVRNYQSQCTQLDNIQSAHLQITVYTAGQYKECVFTNHSVHSLTIYRVRIYQYLISFWGARWHSWLRNCATSRKVAVSIPDGVTGIFQWHNPSGRTMTLGSNQPQTGLSTRCISWG